MLITQRSVGSALIALILAASSACSDSDSIKNSVDNTAAGTPTSSGVIPAHQLNTLQRAKDTEAMLLDKDRQLQEELEKLR